MDKFRIEGLTLHQINLLDVMWTCETPHELQSFKETLPVHDQKTIDVLVRLVHMELIEDEIMNMKTFPDVEKLLDRIKNDNGY